ncbi:hypothetical protein PXK01_16595 [Phaeobacter sp. PT47_59]|uniref:hypothetical protein n=1 Tax=Phaeobacter sp. PT47_59 TaxID=3029979 RepID=UPI002380C44C|nr:hypothetical protein [Phaeobacter sp. PT47_59]MDE4175783.1 hypothetical protein [Phaeobacter sp. PT47_59]
MKPPRVSVSDNAVIRHLELVEGMNIAALRRKIRRKVEFAMDFPGANGVISGGFSYRLKDGVVTTVIPSNGKHKGGSRKHRRGKR